MYGIVHIRSVSVGLDSQIWYLFIYITGYLNVRKMSETMDFRTFVGPLVLVEEFKIFKFDDMLCNLALICPVAFEDMCIYVHTFSEWLFLIATRSTSSMK